MSHLVHIAGPPMRAANLVRTRCAWCGALIEEIDLDQQVGYLTEDGPPESPVDEAGAPRARWAGLVAVETHGERSALGFKGMWVVDEPEDGKIPPDSCMALDVAVTG